MSDWATLLHFWVSLRRALFFAYFSILQDLSMTSWEARSLRFSLSWYSMWGTINSLFNFTFLYKSRLYRKFVACLLEYFLCGSSIYTIYFHNDFSLFDPYSIGINISLPLTHRHFKSFLRIWKVWEDSESNLSYLSCHSYDNLSCRFELSICKISVRYSFESVVSERYTITSVRFPFESTSELLSKLPSIWRE